MPVIVRKIKPDSCVYTDTYRSYDSLDVSKFYHEQINHPELFAVKKNHINGIENFWSQAKRILRKYNGIDRKSFPLFLKECEFRFSFGAPKEQLNILRKWWVFRANLRQPPNKLRLCVKQRKCSANLKRPITS